MRVPRAAGVAAAAAAAVTATAGPASPWTSRQPTSPGPLGLPEAHNKVGRSTGRDMDVLNLMFDALSTMQDTYFERWVGTWPSGNDWTRAVINTHVVATLRTITDELGRKRLGDGDGDGDGGCSIGDRQHLIAGYFADVIAYYFGENALDIRRQAYDDMLWVVLGWLESIQFIQEHGSFLSPSAPGTASGIATWYGDRWTPAFAHRSRIFWELAAQGWDTKLCDGGMLWSPRGLPYKNAVTNELFISASMAMYLRFPGDPNKSPFGGDGGGGGEPASNAKLDWQPRDPVFGRAAQNAHAWLAASNMTNDQGLYADGFHISGLGSGGTRCDQRNEMVYTYNQGILLSGLLGLYEATGRERYLDEGHALVENVIRATGFDLARGRPFDATDGDDDGTATSTEPQHRPYHRRSSSNTRSSSSSSSSKSKNKSTHKLPPWRGLGRLGILEDACDAAGTCSQDGQTFKSIWMHHFAQFCSPTALRPPPNGTSASASTTTSSTTTTTAAAAATAKRAQARHKARCRRYVPWLRRNALAALGTRDDRGRFGMWWTAGLFADDSGSGGGGGGGGGGGVTAEEVDEAERRDRRAGRWPAGAVDYRNHGAPWGEEKKEKKEGTGTETETKTDPGREPPEADEPGGRNKAGQKPLASRGLDEKGGTGPWDPNLRGRGRTLETQAGGLAVLRALWVVSGNE
ncbi:hypothetical protein VTJ83DRAFT_204 [Remersonia thermophila]|uniref:Glycosyl hydrolase n=1 Tax=Remersonia thermophila TaxID=72144 RepID=A0ABR4DKE5_9PEZI